MSAPTAAVSLVAKLRTTQRSRYNLTETLQSWCYAQEMETIEHAFMNVVTTLCGQVRLYITDVKPSGTLIRYLKDVNVDLEDDVSAFLRRRGAN